MNQIVHVIIPIYNTDKYLRDCLDSVFNQTFGSVFVICVNDGSTDNSLDILNEYSELHPNMTIISQPNIGVSAARNAAIKLLPNEGFCVFLDSDDVIDNNFISILVEHCIRYNSDCVLLTKNIAKESNREEVVKLFLDWEIARSPTKKIYKNTIVKSALFDESLLTNEDCLFNFKCFLRCNSFYLLNRLDLYYHRPRVGSLSSDSIISNDKLLDMCEGWMKSYNTIINAIDDHYLRNYFICFVINEYLEAYFNLYKVNFKQRTRLKTIKHDIGYLVCLKYMFSNKFIPSKHFHIKLFIYSFLRFLTPIIRRAKHNGKISFSTH